MAASESQIKKYSGPWTSAEIKHLVLRTSFGAPLDDLDYFKGKSMEECVDVILRPMTPLTLPVGEDTDKTGLVFDPENKIAEPERSFLIKVWWVGVMTDPQRSITEKMVLFWHNHFVVEFDTVKDGRYDHHYLTVLRRNATGNFKKMLREITTDPAMLVYLNGNLNDKTVPNENYGRELQELFAVGKGPDSHYTESDVKAAAKVLTGWKDDKKNIGSYFDPASHNTEDKAFSAFYNNHTIKGRSGEDGAKETDELIEMICSTAEVSKFLCRKLYRWFVHSNIDEQVEKNVISPLAGIMVRSGYEIRPVLRAIFTSAFFYNPDLRGGLFKGPADYFIGITREFNMDFCDDFSGRYVISNALEELGQNIGNPPSVAGWPAYYEFPIYDKNWLSSENLAARYKVMKLLLMTSSDNPMDFNFTGFISRLPEPGDPKTLVQGILDLLCSLPPGAGQTAYIQGLLDIGENDKRKWSELWSAWQSNPGDYPTKEEILSRLHKIFYIILLLPEYQIM